MARKFRGRRKFRRGKKKVILGFRSNKLGTYGYKSRRPNRNLTSVPVGLGFPKRMVMTHKYNEQIVLTTGGAGALNYTTWTCNGMYDPLTSVGGHQPMYFDQMAALYNHYTVIGSKIVVRVISTTAQTPNNVPLTVGCFINDDTTLTYTTFQTLMENSLGKHRIIGTTDKTQTTFGLKWSAKKVFGGSILGNDNLIGTAGANPTEMQNYTFWMDSSTPAVASSCILDVSIQYIAVWSELKEIAGS